MAAISALPHENVCTLPLNLHHRVYGIKLQFLGGAFLLNCLHRNCSCHLAPPSLIMQTQFLVFMYYIQLCRCSSADEIVNTVIDYCIDIVGKK